MHPVPISGIRRSRLSGRARRLRSSRPNHLGPKKQRVNTNRNKARVVAWDTQEAVARGTREVVAEEWAVGAEAWVAGEYREWAAVAWAAGAGAEVGSKPSPSRARSDGRV